MVDRLKAANRLQIHQTLHGYSDGHRLISSSIQLPANDAKTVLTLSDSSGGTGWREGAGYLTGYPLRESGKYALARTWQAPEMSRPGCVWTHTLIFDLSDLANLSSCEGILALFRRPDGSSPSISYTEPLVVQRQIESQMVSIGQDEATWCRQLLIALYEYPKDEIVAVAPPFDPEPLLLEVWLQQWPRLRRSFCFCTSTTMDRSSDRLRFDIQMLPIRDRGAAARIPNSRNLSECSPTQAPWIDDAIDDLFESRNASLRLFLLRIGGEVLGGRSAFVALVAFHRLLVDADSNPSAIDAALSVASDAMPESSTAGRMMLAGKAVKHVGQLSEVAHEFLLSHLSLLDRDTLLAHAERIGEVTWTVDPKRFSALLDGSENELTVGARTLEVLTSEQVIIGLHKSPEIVSRILTQRPDIAATPTFWEDDALAEAAFTFLSGKLSQASEAVAAMIKCGAGRYAWRAFASFGSREVWTALAPAMDRATSNDLHALQPWIKSALEDADGVAEVLASGRIHARKSLVMIARISEPDLIPNDFGDDPWVLALRVAKGKLSQVDNTYLKAYLMARAFGSRSRNCAELAALSFDHLHSAAADETISEDAWMILDRQLPVTMFWGGWDRCERMRRGMAELFVKRELSPRVFPTLTENDELFGLLVKSVASVWGGRSYLKRVRQALTDAEGLRRDSLLAIVDHELY